MEKEIEILNKKDIKYNEKDYLLLREVYDEVEKYLYSYKYYDENDDNCNKLNTLNEHYARYKTHHDSFLLSMYHYIISDIDSSSRTKMFFQNIIDSNVIKSHKINSRDYKNNLTEIFIHFRDVKPEYEEKFINFIKYIEEKYLEFTNLDKKINLLFDNKKFEETKNINHEISKETYNKEILLPNIFLYASIAIFTITMIASLTGSGFNIFFFITSLIGIIMSYSERSAVKKKKDMTCENCNQWNSLQIINEEIRKSENVIRTESYYTGSYSAQNRRERPYTVRIDTYCYTCECSNCGYIDYKFEDREYRL